jgi:hypothetical protein
MRTVSRLFTSCAAALVPAVSLAGSWVREMDVRSEPESQGQKVYMVRFTPEKTTVYDEISFECVYRQEMPWEDIRGRKYTKILEPVTFIFRRSTVSFVNELDADINFKVPVSYARLSEKFGLTVFNKAYPITINRIRISAVSGGAPAWQVELTGEGRFDTREMTAVKEDAAASGQASSTNAPAK